MMAESREIDLNAVETAREEMSNLVRTVARSRVSKEDLALAMSREHRTEQQIFGSLVLPLISHWAEDHTARRYDMRNEAICRVSRKIVDSMGDAWPDNCFLPYI